MRTLKTSAADRIGVAIGLLVCLAVGVSLYAAVEDVVFTLILLGIFAVSGLAMARSFKEVRHA